MIKPLKEVLCIVALLTACTNPGRQGNNDSLNGGKSDHLVNYTRLSKADVTGDFDGDGKTDTLSQTIISGQSGLEIDSIPENIFNTWDSVAIYMDAVKADLIICGTHRAFDTLHLGSGTGLYYLNNIGDTNNDGREELALVIDRCDMSRVNSCKIYGLCKNKWIELKSFGVHEDAFDMEGDSTGGILNYLTLKNTHWFYNDYNEVDYENEQAVGRMKELFILPCEK